MKRTTKFLAPLTLMATLALTGCSFLYIPVDSSSEKPSSETSTSSSASEDTSEESTSQTSYVEEPGKVTNIVVSFVKDTINVGSTIQATATIAPADAINKNVTWSSSNKAVATVDREGLVTGVSEGQTTITAIAADGSGVFGEATLNVTLATGGTTKHILGQNLKNYMNHYADSQIDSCPSIGSPKILVIPVWFTNSTDYISESKKEDVRSDIEACYFGTNSDTGWHSVKSYYQTESMGKLRLDGTVSSWYECGKAVSYYGNSEDRTVSLVTEATDWYFTNNPTESRKDYDLDGNGGLDAVCLIYGAPDYSQASVGSNFWAYCYWTGEYPNINAPTANTFFWASYDFMYSSGSTARSRTGKASYGSGDTRYCTLDAHSFIHEFGHVLGLEDYYDYSGTSSPAAGFSMQDMNIGGHDPYSTMLFGWADPYVATESGEITIGAFQSTHELIVLSPQWNSYDSPFDEYLLLELYTPTGLNAFDNANNYGGAYPTGASQAGIRLWHVDGRLATYNTRTGTFSRQLTANANGSNVIFAMSNTYPNSSTQGYGSPLGSSYDNYNQLQMIRNRTSSGHKASANDYLRNADLFRSGESFDMATYGSQFVNTGKFNSSKALGWSFSVSISGSGDAAQATITLTKE